VLRFVFPHPDNVTRRGAGKPPCSCQRQEILGIFFSRNEHCLTKRYSGRLLKTVMGQAGSGKTPNRRRVIRQFDEWETGEPVCYEQFRSIRESIGRIPRGGR